MNFKTRPHFEDRQLVQYFGESIKLSGDTLYANTGVVKIEPTILDFTGTTTPVTINGLTGYLNDNNRVSGLVVNPPILKLSGSTGTTTVNVENFVLKAIDSDGTAVWSPISGVSWSVSACTSPFLTTDIQPCTPGGTITINAGDLEINNTVRINDGSQSNGYVFTSDGSGNGSWQPNYVFTGNTSGDCITDLYITNLYGCSPITVWDNLQTVGSTASGDYSNAFGFGSTASGDTSFIHSTNSTVSGNRSVVLGGQNITGTTDDTVYTPNLNVSGSYLLHSDNILEITDLGFESGFKGGYTEFNWNGLTSNIISNSNTSGYTSYLLGNFSNFPTQRDYGFISYYNTNHTRIGTPTVTGSGFYRNKLVIKTALDSIGTVFSNDDLVNFWWEIDGESKMILNPNGNLGIALNPDGTESPTVNLQIGGTGTTGTFKYVDGNQQSGYVLTSDSNGNATWQINNSSFTGNTSGDCINDIFVSNIHSCSPLNINPLDEGNVYFGSNSGFTVDLGNGGSVYTKGEYVIQSDIDANSIIPLLEIGNNKGFVQLLDYTGNTGFISINTSTSGLTGLVLGTGGVGENGLIRYHGSDYLRDTMVAVNGIDFYQNKMLVSGGLDSDGLIIAGTPSSNNSRIWFEQNGNSPMMIAGGGTPNDLRLGIALNPNGTETPTAQLQVGGTGTTGTFKYIDGNQSNGYVLTSDSDGNATWQLNGFLYEIGEYVSGEGGVIFHRYLTGGTQEYLVVDTSNLSTGVEYSNLSTTSIGSTARSFWDGLSNSNAIAAQSGHTTSAANLCLTSTNNGKSDWYLPSEGELNLIFDNRYELSKTLTTVSGATDINYDRIYWSSTERAATTAYAKSIFGVTSEDKSVNWYVRAIRKFSI
jgi:hypothetical protein